jgi:RNA polymerase sigma-70 factor (ECF subfamily)
LIVPVTEEDPETEELLGNAGAGGPGFALLVGRYRDSLRRMISARLDTRLAAILDPSDVVQEALADASQKLECYLRDRPLPFYPWLRRLASERIIQLHRHHIGTQKRNVDREQRLDLALSDGSAIRLAKCLVASDTSPSQQLLRDERARQVRGVLQKLGSNDREILILVYLESLDFGEAGAALGIKENAAKVRHFRALKRVRELLEGGDLGEDRP